MMQGADTAQAVEPVVIGKPLAIEAVVRVARSDAPVQLDEEARQRVRRSRRYVEHLLAENRVVYGVTTGLGKLVHQRISADETRALQRNLLLSHAMGIGEPFPTEIVRAMMLLRAQSLALGHSGVREEVIEGVLGMLNRRVHPVVPSQGSVGASGDLAPLAHMSLVMG
jgi:histidine ammonia-lyase